MCVNYKELRKSVRNEDQMWDVSIVQLNQSWNKRFVEPENAGFRFPQLPKLDSYESIEWKTRLESCSNSSLFFTIKLKLDAPIQKDLIDFIAIPKAGTWSISKWFSLPHEHWTIVQKQDQDITKYNGAKFRFAIVRNSFERMFSWFHYCVCARNIPGPFSYCKRALRFSAAAGEDQHLAFQNWLKLWVNQPGVHNYWISSPQKEWITNKDGKIDVDFLMRLEHIKEDTVRLMCMTGLQMKPDHKVKNPFICNATQYLNSLHKADCALAKGANVSVIIELLGSRKKYREFYDEESEKIVRDLMAPDLDFFGYEF